MHHTKKKKAIGLIGGEKNTEVITKLLLENKFTQDEVGEVLTLLASPGGANDDEKPAPAKTTMSAATSNEQVGYEEWRCEVKIERDGKTEVSRKADKLKKLRSNVKITEQEAETWNDGQLYSPRQDYVIMYFKPE
jgi:hypothetical protein